MVDRMYTSVITSLWFILDKSGLNDDKKSKEVDGMELYML